MIPSGELRAVWKEGCSAHDEQENGDEKAIPSKQAPKPAVDPISEISGHAKKRKEKKDGNR